MKCSIPACTREAATYGALCKTHQTAKRRYGSPDQKPISKSELGDAMSRVERLIASRKRPELIRDKLRRGFEQVQRDARADVTSPLRVPGGRTRQRAASDVLAICEEAPREEVILTVLALAFIMASQPRRFVSDRAFFITSGRRLRMLAKSAYSSTFNSETATRSRTPKDTSPDVLHAIGQRFMEAFGAIGMALHDVEIKEQGSAKENRTDAIRLIFGDEGTGD